MNAQMFPFNLGYHLHDDTGHAFEPIAEPLYFTAIYPKGGTKALTFFASTYGDASKTVDNHGLDVTNLRTCRLPCPQHFLMIGLTMRPIPRDLRPEFAHFHYSAVRSLGTYRLFIGQKSYSEGPLDHILDLSAHHDDATSIGDKFWPVVVTTKPGDEAKERALPIMIPSEQAFWLDARWENPHDSPFDLPLRLYIVGCRLREVA